MNFIEKIFMILMIVISIFNLFCVVHEIYDCYNMSYGWSYVMRWIRKGNFKYMGNQFSNSCTNYKYYFVNIYIKTKG